MCLHVIYNKPQQNLRRHVIGAFLKSFNYLRLHMQTEVGKHPYKFILHI
jgi:hypothetical protein